MAEKRLKEPWSSSDTVCGVKVLLDDFGVFETPPNLLDILEAQIY